MTELKNNLIFEEQVQAMREFGKQFYLLKKALDFYLTEDLKDMTDKHLDGLHDLHETMEHMSMNLDHFTGGEASHNGNILLKGYLDREEVTKDFQYFRNRLQEDMKKGIE